MRNNINLNPLPFVLGGNDPEMEYIERLLKEEGKCVLYAAVQDVKGTRRVFANKEAYEFTHLIDQAGNITEVSSYACDAHNWEMEFNVVECKPKTVYIPCSCKGEGCYHCKDGVTSMLIGGIRIDHHNPGDPGFGKEPSLYMEGSSLGQLIRLFGKEPTKEQMFIAAGDHCIAAAYKGMCPGVDPDELLDFRVEGKVAFQKKFNKDITKEDIMKAVKAASKELVTREYFVEGGRRIYVVWDQIPELPEGASLAGEAYIALIEERGTGKLKFSLGGEWNPEVFELVMGKLDLTGKYGDPLRGIGGGYIKEGDPVGVIRTVYGMLCVD